MIYNFYYKFYKNIILDNMFSINLPKNYLSSHKAISIDLNLYQGCRKFGKISGMKKFTIISRCISPPPLSPSYTADVPHNRPILAIGPHPYSFFCSPFLFPFRRAMATATDPSRALGCR